MLVKKVAITGGLSSGKSSVCQFLKNLGATVISADEIVHQLLAPNTDTGQRVIEAFGSEVLKGDAIDRSVIAQIVFNNPKELKVLEQILHPAVKEKLQSQFDEFKRQRKPFVFVEIPLLFEAGMDDLFDLTVAVQAEEKICKKRFKGGAKEFEKRMKRQLSNQEKSKRADYKLSNEGSLNDLQVATQKLYDEVT